MTNNMQQDYPAMISVNPEVHFGKPCVAGTRIPVANVLELIEAGTPLHDIVTDYYPDLTEEQVKACVRYAIDVIQNEKIHFVQAIAA